MIKDTAIMKAVSKIRRRAERQQSIDMLLATFVDIGILPRLLNVQQPNHLWKERYWQNPSFKGVGVELKS